MRRPTRVRYDYARAKARLVVSEFGLVGPPVDVEAIMKERGIFLFRHKPIGPVNYSVTFRDPTANLYYVSIIISTPGRENWDKGHEFGHVELKHHEQYDVDTLDGDRLTELERWILDREANIFARDLLMPAMWVRREAGGAVGFADIAPLADLFGVSWEAMLIRLDEVGLLADGARNQQR